MTLDSPAAFSDRVREMDFTEDHSTRFRAAGWRTFAHLAFACPQGASEEQFTRNILVPGLGGADPIDKVRPVGAPLL